MAQSFDELPLYDKIVDKNNNLSPVWQNSLATHYQTLISFLTESGIVMPNLAEETRKKLNSPQNGQLIYNTTADAPQFYQASSKSWRTISFT